MTSSSPGVPANPEPARKDECPDPEFPDPDCDPEFVKARRGNVHVVSYRRAFINALGKDYTAAEILMLGPIPTRCGKTLHRHIGGLEQNAYSLDTFPDEQLCRACVGTVPVADQHRLFAHPTAPEASR